eukprot:m.119250 g.119250  ORF g.119250 m.119250 type:complete len:209 (+) comp15466_c1_seq1:320-946(+)
MADQTQQQQQQEEQQNTTLAVPKKIVEHALCDTWCLWYDNPASLPANPTDQQYKDNLKLVYKFDTVEKFFRMYNNIKPVEEMSGCNFHLFRNGISPTWEDPGNKNGGKLVCNTAVDAHLWLTTCLTIIGGLYGPNQDQVCGAVAQLKKMKTKDRINVWTKDEKNEGAVRAIGGQWKKLCSLPRTIEFVPHVQSSTSKSSTFARGKWTI